MDNVIRTPIINVMLGAEQPGLARALLALGFLKRTTVVDLSRSPPKLTSVYQTDDTVLESSPVLSGINKEHYIRRV